jgi:hypothetical protein
MQDFRFYVGVGNLVYTKQASDLVGFVCETEIQSLQLEQISINELKQVDLYTNTSQCAVQIEFAVNITLNGTIGASQINAPNQTVYQEALKDCNKELILNTGGGLFKLNQSFYIEICGSVQVESVEMLKNALLDAWLVARPGNETQI